MNTQITAQGSVALCLAAESRQKQVKCELLACYGDPEVPTEKLNQTNFLHTVTHP